MFEWILHSEKNRKKKKDRLLEKFFKKTDKDKKDLFDCSLSRKKIIE